MENIAVAITEKDFNGRPAQVTIHVKFDVGAPDRASVGEVDSDAQPETKQKVRIRFFVKRNGAIGWFGRLKEGRWEGSSHGVMNAAIKSRE